MNRLALFVLGAVLLGASGPSRADSPEPQAPQGEKKFEVTFSKVETKGKAHEMTLDFTVETNLPKETVLCFFLRVWWHEYKWKEQVFHFGNFNTSPISLVNQTVKDKKIRVEHMPIPMPGFYELVAFFNPIYQTKSDVVRKGMGKANYHEREYPGVRVTLGDPRNMTQTLMDDTEDCHEQVKKALEILEKIEKESEAKDWDKKQPEVEKQIISLRSKAAQRSVQTLHHATYRMIDDLLEDIKFVNSNPAVIRSQGQSYSPPGAGGASTSDEMPVFHEKGAAAPGSGGVILGGHDAHKLSFPRTKENIKLCDRVRLREYFSWLTIFLKDGKSRLDDAYAAAKKDAKEAEGFKRLREQVEKVIEDTDRAFKHIEQYETQKEMFEEITKYYVEGIKEPQKFGDIFKKLTAYTLSLQADLAKGAADVPDEIKKSQDVMKAHIEAARTKALGSTKKPENP